MSVAGRMDRYVGWTVVEAYLGALVFMIFLSILVDTLMNMSRYIQIGAEYDIPFVRLLGYLAQYYAVLMPFLFVTVAPFVTVIACMFAVSRLMSSNEVAPMIFTGRSLYRVLYPVLLVGMLSAVLMAACWELVIPALAETKATKEYVLGSHEEAKDVLLVMDSLSLRCEGYYHDEQPRMEGVTLYDKGTGPGDVQITLADMAYWRPDHGDWELEGGVLHRGEDTQPARWLGAEGFTPNLLWRSGQEASTTSSRDSWRGMTRQMMMPMSPRKKHKTAPIVGSRPLLFMIVAPANANTKAKTSPMRMPMGAPPVARLADCGAIRR